MDKKQKSGTMVFVLILALAIAIPIFLFGMGTVFKFYTSPIINGRISIWWILLGLLVFIMYSRRQRRPVYR
jgi:hypothetical protein